MGHAEDRLSQAERSILEAEMRIARQTAVVEGFEAAGDGRAAERAGEMLAVMRTGLGLALFYLAIESMWPDEGPDGLCRHGAERDDEHAADSSRDDATTVDA